MTQAHEVRVSVTEGAPAALVLVGEIDLTAVDEIQTRVDELLATTPTAVVVDLGPTTFLDSSGIGALVGLHNQAGEQGIDLTFRRGPANVMRVLEIVGLMETFTFTD